MSKYFRTIIEVEVLSEDEPVQTIDLETIARATDEGPWVGHVDIKDTKELTGKQMANALYAVHSEPAFFMLDDEGRNR